MLHLYSKSSFALLILYVITALFFLQTLDVKAQNSKDSAIQEKNNQNYVLFKEATELAEIGTAESLKKSLIIFIELRKLSIKSGNKKDEIYCLGWIGDIYGKLGEQKKALDYYDESLPLIKQIGDKTYEAVTLTKIGETYRKLNETQKAFEHYEIAIKFYKSVDNKAGEADVLNNVGLLFDSLGDRRQALRYFNQALQNFKDTKNTQGEAYTLNNIGTAYKDLNERQKALEYLNQALPILYAIGDKRGAAYTLNNIGNVHGLLGDYQKAIQYFGAALPFRRFVGDIAGQATTLSNLSAASYRMGELHFTIVLGKLSIKRYQELRTNIQELDKSSQQSYLKSIEVTYRYTIEILIKENRLAEAQQILNLWKDQQFFDSNMGQNKQLNFLTLTKREEKFFADFDKVLIKVGEAGNKLANLAADLSGRELSVEEKAKFNQLTLDMQQAGRDYLIFFADASQEFHTTHTELDKTPIISDFKTMQETLRQLTADTQQKVVAVYQLAGEENFSVIIISADDIKSVSTPIKNSILDEKAVKYWALLQSNKYDPTIPGKELYDVVFAPIEKILPKDTKTIMWSMDGNLRYIPMAALHDGNNYLVENYRNIIFTKNSLASLTSENETDWQILGAGVSEKRENFNALPGVKTELETIVRAPDNPKGILSGEIRRDDNFKKQTFLNTLGGGAYPVIHIASHYSFDTAKQENSFLLVGDGRLTFLEMKENKNLFGTVDLLTLSACDTGVSGNGKEAEGFAYLAQSLGAKSVIASLWKVSDAGTPELVIRFYKLRAVNPNLSKGEAFRQAQLSLFNSDSKNVLPQPTAKVETKESKGNANQKRTDVIDLSGKTIELPSFVKDDKKPFAHPHYWSSFVLIGNWR